MFIVGALARQLISGTHFNLDMRGYPHFTSPLNDVREIREMLYMYERTGKFYARPSQIGQSELLMKLIYFFAKLFEDEHGRMNSSSAIYFVSAISELASMIAQLITFYSVYSISRAKSKFTNLAMYWIVFNPISLIGGFTYIGSFNDALFYICAILPILDEDPS